MMPFYIQRAAQWTLAGRGRLHEPLMPPAEAAAPPVWAQACKLPFERFPRLDPLSKLVNVLAEWVLEGVEVSREMGMVLSTRYGCVEADLAYYRSAATAPELASPQLFPYTLPSAGLAETAIRHRLQGPAMVFLQEAGLQAVLGQAAGWLEAGDTTQCLVVCADAVLEEGAHALQVPEVMAGWAFVAGKDRGLCKVTGQGTRVELSPEKFFAGLEGKTFSHPEWVLG